MQRAVSTEFELISYGDKIKDYNGKTWIFAGVMGKEVVVSQGNTVNDIKVMKPSIFDLMILDD